MWWPSRRSDRQTGQRPSHRPRGVRLDAIRVSARGAGIRSRAWQASTVQLFLFDACNSLNTPTTRAVVRLGLLDATAERLRFAMCPTGVALEIEPWQPPPLLEPEYRENWPLEAHLALPASAVTGSGSATRCHSGIAASVPLPVVPTGLGRHRRRRRSGPRHGAQLRPGRRSPAGRKRGLPTQAPRLAVLQARPKHRPLGSHRLHEREHQRGRRGVAPTHTKVIHSASLGHAEQLAHMASDD